MAPPPQPLSAIERMRKIYIDGVYGRKQKVPTDFDRLKKLAEQKLSRKNFTYIAGGASSLSIDFNRRSLDELRIIPRMLRDVSQVGMSTHLFDRKLPAPLLLAPVGVLELAQRQGDLAVAAACKSTGIPMIISSQASFPMEETSGVLGETNRWFQLYWSKSDDLVRSFIARAENCGCAAIVVTLDTTMLGWRHEDLDLGHLPFVQGKGIAQYTSDPVFLKLAARHYPPPQDRKPSLPAILNLLKQAGNYPGNFWKNLRTGRARKGVSTFLDIYSRPGITWKELEFLRSITDLPILLKGILHPADAQLAIDHGMNGLIVSNHGGRQINGVVSSAEMLPGIIQQVAGKAKVLVDSGIRNGADIFKMLALGADAVLIGRPYVYALAVAGSRGVEELLRNMTAEFELTMRLAGCRTIAEITSENLHQ